MKYLSKLLLLITVLFLFTTTVHAQNAIAKINYEQAEEAFEKNDYTVTLAKLDEAQKILGTTNPKVLYLRLMAAKGIIATGKFNWEFLAETRTNAAYYLKHYSEIAGVGEKLRQVYEFSETLETLPKTKEVFDQKEAEAAQARNEWLKQRPVQVSDSLLNTLGVKTCKIISGFLNSSFASQLKKSNESSRYTTIYERKVNYSGYPPAGPFEARFNDKGQCFFYSYILLSKTTDTATAKKVYSSFVDLYPAELGKEWVERKELTRENELYEKASLIVKQPGTGNQGEIWISYYQYADSALILISFYPQV
jgi:hypothetical protein